MFNRSFVFDLWQLYYVACHRQIRSGPGRLPTAEPGFQGTLDSRAEGIPVHPFCDGYDKSRQTRNMYSSNRVNEQGEWRVRTVIKCP